MPLLQRIKRTIVISRPLFWPSTFLAFILGVIFSRHDLNPSIITFALLWSFPYSLWICTVNDLADPAGDEINTFKGGLAGAKITNNEKRFVYQLQWTSALVIIIPTIITGNLILILTTAIALIVPYIYSTYPIRLKEHPPLDSLSNGGFVATVFLTGFVYVHPVQFSLLFFQAFIGFFFGVSAIHIIGALRDFTPDKRSHVKTIAVAWGQKKSAYFAAILFLFVFLVIYNFPLEFRLYSMIGAITSIYLAFRPNEKISWRIGLFLILGFVVVALFSIIFNSWKSLNLLEVSL